MSKRTVRIRPKNRQAFAQWLLDAGHRNVRTISSTEFGLPPHLLAMVPEDLLIGAHIDSKPYRGVHSLASGPKGKVKLRKNGQGKAVVQRIEEPERTVKAQPKVEPKPEVPDPVETAVEPEQPVEEQGLKAELMETESEPVSQPEPEPVAKKTTTTRTVTKSAAKAEDNIGVQFGALPGSDDQSPVEES